MHFLGICSLFRKSNFASINTEISTEFQRDYFRKEREKKIRRNLDGFSVSGLTLSGLISQIELS